MPVPAILCCLSVALVPALCLPAGPVEGDEGLAGPMEVDNELFLEMQCQNLTPHGYSRTSE